MVVFERDHNLFAVNGPDENPAPVTSGGQAGPFVFSSATNSVFYLQSTESSQPGQVEEVDLIGKEQKLVSEKRYYELAVSPSGNLLLGMEGTTPPFDNWSVVSATSPAPKELPADIASLAWSPNGRNFIYVHGQSDVSLRSLYLYNLDTGQKKTVLSNLSGPASTYEATQEGVTAAAWAADGQSVFYGLSYWNNTAANNISSKNGIYRYDLNTSASSELAASPGQSVYMLHCLADGGLVYAAGPVYPALPPDSTLHFTFWRLPSGSSRPEYLFSLSVNGSDELPVSWLSDGKALLYYNNGQVWSMPIAPGAHGSPVNGSGGATYFSGGGDEGDLTTVLLVNPDNTRFAPGPPVPVPPGGGQTGPPASTSPPEKVQVSLSPDGSMVVSGQAALTALINRLPYGGFVILPDRVVAGEYFPLSHPLTSLADLDGKAATGSFPGDAATAEHAIPGGEPAGTNLVPIKNSNVFLWVPTLDVNGMLPAGHYLLYVGRSYGDPLVGHFEWLNLSEPVDYLSFLKQALILVSGTS